MTSKELQSVRVFRKVVLPVVWVAIFATIAVSLAVLAFGGDDEESGGGPKPTGELVLSQSSVERATIENTLDVRGTIAVDPPVTAKAPESGVVNHAFVPAGAKVDAGDPVFQVRSEAAVTDDEESEDEAEAPAATPRYYTVVAPKSGTVGDFAVEIGDTVAKGDTVTSIHQTTFRATGSIAPADRYRLIDLPASATVTIASGPEPFTCKDLRITDTTAPAAPDGAGGQPDVDEFSGDPEASGGESGATISCRVPENVRVFDGLSMKMSIQAGRAEDVLTVPVTAVRGLVESGTVWVVDESGEGVERDVSLGLTDGEVVEVTKGLEEGEAILEFAPGNEASDDMDGQYMEMG